MQLRRPAGLALHLRLGLVSALQTWTGKEDRNA